MKIPQICTNKMEWLDYFTSAFNEQSHLYICLTNNNRLTVDKKLASRLKIDEIIKISRFYLFSYQHHELEKLRACYMSILEQRKFKELFWTKVIHFFRGMGFINTENLIKQEIQLIDKSIDGKKTSHFRAIKGAEDTG